MESSLTTQVLVIGAGPAGYTAALYLARAGRQPLVITGRDPGGQLSWTTDVENFPGFPHPIQGPWLMEEMAKQAQNYGAALERDIIQKVDFQKRPFTCYGENGTYTSSAVIIATGARPRWLGLEDEAFFRGYGVSSCATCDGRFFRGKKVVVVGGGNSAAEEALHLTQHASHVTLIHRRSEMRADKLLQDRLKANPKMTFLWDHVVTQIEGTSSPKAVTHVMASHVQTGRAQRLEASGVFIAIGHLPNTSLFTECLEQDEEGYIIGRDNSSETSIPGVFVAGDVRDKVYRQAITAAGQGCMAALDAERFLQCHPL